MSDDLHRVLGRVERFVGRFVAFQSDDQRVAVTLWIAHTYAFEAAYCTPRLAIQSAEKQSVKTRLLEVLDLLVLNPKQVANISEAALFRSIDGGDITILFDETDAIFGPKASKEHEDLRALLNMGYRRGATVPRCVGPKNEVHDFSTFAPVALAGIGALPDTIEDRSIIIRLRRRAPHERVEKLRQRMIEPERIGETAQLYGRENLDHFDCSDRDTFGGLVGRPLPNLESRRNLASLFFGLVHGH